MEACTRLWVRRCLMCKAGKTFRQKLRWPVLSSPLPNRPCVSTGVDYFGPFLTKAGRNSHIILFKGRFSHHEDMYAVIAAEFLAEGTSDILVNRFVLLWGFPSTFLSDNG